MTRVRSQKTPRRGLPSPALFITLMTVLSIELAAAASLVAYLQWSAR